MKHFAACGAFSGRWGYLRSGAGFDWRAYLPGLIVVSAVLIGPALYRADPLAMDLAHQLTPPGAAHLLGTDDYGRDILARLLAGGRSSVLMAMGVVVPSGLAGICLGGLAAASKRLDWLVMRICEIFLSVPTLVVALFCLAVLGGGRASLWMTLAAFGWMGYARLTRDLARRIMRSEYAAAARTAGGGKWWIMRRHVLPNAAAPLLSYAALNIGSVVLIMAELGFLGFGVQPPSPDWGLMLAEARGYIGQAPWLMAWPALAVAIVVLAAGKAARSLNRPLSGRGRLV